MTDVLSREASGARQNPVPGAELPAGADFSADHKHYARAQRLVTCGLVLSRVGAVAGVLAAVVLVFAATRWSALQGTSGEVSEPALVISVDQPSLAEETGSLPNDRLDQPADSSDPSSSSRVDPGWLSRTAAATGIPQRALRAYAGANIVIAGEQPGCGVQWNTLAAIGAVESAHAGHGGSVLGDDGYPRPSIVGPTLDGNGVAAIRDTDDGRWDGDPRWDRAVGPMQFIPSTWARWGADGNTDGVADPHQLDDATLAAARYLCASGSMRGAGWRRAILSYNHSDAYVDKIATAANQYASAASR